MESREASEHQPTSIRLGDGVDVDLDAQGDTPVGIDLEGSAKVSGRFRHEPQPAGNTTYIRHLTSGSGASKLQQDPLSIAKEFATGSSSSFASFERAAGRDCECGFSAFAWQSECPRCGADIH